MRVLVEAYGCTLNKGEAEEFTEAIIDNGNVVIASEAEAEAFAIFTCGVIETTEKHMLKRIGQLSKYKEKKLLVCGCLGNINPESILKNAPHAQLFGPSEHMLASEIFSNSNERKMEKQATSKVGILPIATGCSGDCSYCITKKARGPLKSRTAQEIKQRLEMLVADGFVEIQICAQDTAIYGTDIGSNLGNLIEELETVDGDYMMRIGMMNPASLKNNFDNIVRAYASKKIFKFLHLPAQSGSIYILDAMNRRHLPEDYVDLVNEFKARYPEMALSTDTIIGFPGETDEDFQTTIELMEKIKPDIINITRFSSRPGTPADLMKNKVPSWIAKERSRIMTELRFRLTGQNYGKMNGQIVRALATERHIDGTSFLRTRNYKPIVIYSDIELGKWYEIEITGASRVYLNGKLYQKH